MDHQHWIPLVNSHPSMLMINTTTTIAVKNKVSIMYIYESKNGCYEVLAQLK